MSTEYNIPVKIRIEAGRFRFGYVRKLPTKRGEKVSIKYPSGRISSRNGDSMIHEPKGFNVLTT